MNFQEYQAHFQDILQETNKVTPYNNPEFINYTKLNWSRMNRWLKMGQLSEEIKNNLAQISKNQNWIVITEPWCGDAAHIVPFIQMIASQNDKISISFELRDSEPHRIDNYLTNGKSKAIPKLIIQNDDGEDLAVWGPRPIVCQKLSEELIAQNISHDELKTALQHWYNKDEGKEIMSELSALILETTKN
jgi:hypothetical protein